MSGGPSVRVTGWLVVVAAAAGELAAVLAAGTLVLAPGPAGAQLQEPEPQPRIITGGRRYLLERLLGDRERQRRWQVEQEQFWQEDRRRAQDWDDWQAERELEQQQLFQRMRRGGRGGE
jgi:hypothetical protein